MTAIGFGHERRALATSQADGWAKRLVLSLAIVVTSTAGEAIPASWSAPDMDLFFYPRAVDAGGRELGPTFAGSLEIAEEGDRFAPRSAQDPARLGMVLVAFDTATDIAPGLSPSRYQIDSVVLTMTMQSGTAFPPDFSPIHYSDAPIGHSEIFEQVSSGDISNARPMELFGVGLRADYMGYDFSGVAGGPPLLSESTHPYSASDDGYIAYPIVGGQTQAGHSIDVSNSVTGGYSATAPDNYTDPFDPLPWAIGKTGLPPDDPIPDDTTFRFELDLTLPGVRQYLQDSLAAGALGLFVSSLHQTGMFGEGGGYPQWYMKEAADLFGGTPATLMIEYQVVDERLPGDYDGNSKVELADYEEWKLAFGALIELGTGADGNGDGVVDAADYTVWRDNLDFALEAMGRSTTASGRDVLRGATVSTSVPEPGTLVILLPVVAWCRICRCADRRFVRPPRLCPQVCGTRSCRPSDAFRRFDPIHCRTP